MSTLITTPNLKNADDIYAMLLAAHEDLSLEGSTALNARLVLLLVNHIGDAGVIEEALEMAKQG